QAAMTVDQVRDAVAREGDHWFSNSSAPITYRFGVFHGYGGNGRIDDVPGWLVLQAPIEVYPHCPVNTPPSSCQPKPGYQAEVVSDGDGSRLAGVVQQTGPPPDLG